MIDWRTDTDADGIEVSRGVDSRSDHSTHRPVGVTMGPDPIAGVSHVSLSVRDLDVSLEFYRDVLGLEVFVKPFEGTVFDGREAMVRAGRVVICLQAHRANDGSTFTPTRTGLDHLAFHLSTRRQLEEWDRYLSDCGVTHSPIKSAGDFGSMIELRDPDNTQIELFVPA